MADHSVVAWNELYESEASWASVFCFHNASSEKSCFVRDLVFFISLRLRVFIFLNATRRDRNCPAFASKGKKWIHPIHWDKGSELTITAGTEVCSLHFQVGRPLIENRLNDELLRWCYNTISMACTFPKAKKSCSWKLCTFCHYFIQTESSTKKVLRWYHQANELQLPPSLKPVKALSQMTTTWS